MSNYAGVQKRLEDGAFIDPSKALSPAGKAVLRTSCQTVSSHVVRNVPPAPAPEAVEDTMPLYPRSTR